MKKIYFFITSALCCSITPVSSAFFPQQIIKLKPHEEWWENNCDLQKNTFAQWLGDINAPSRVAMRAHVREKKYESIIDIPCGLCTDYDGFQADHMNIAYQGVDITPKLINSARNRSIPLRQGSIEAIPFGNCLFDIAYARHILEHLDYYKEAIKELIRVARREVLIVFFMKPSGFPDFIDGQANGNTQGYLLYHNVYNKKSLEDYLKTFSRVSGFDWQDVDEKEVILHIYLKNEF